MTDQSSLVSALLAIAASTAASAAPATKAHDTFAVLDVKIGMPVAGLRGFACTKPSNGPDREDLHCVKFLDSRCAGAAAAIGTLRYGEKAPLGCFLDHSSHASYLDGKLLQTPNTGDSSDPRQRNPLKPLASLHVVGTRSDPSKIYRISYTLLPDDLVEGSKLYTALVAKYGEPSRKNPPHQMRWAMDDTKLEAECSPNRQCQITVEDRNFEDIETRRQKEVDDRARQQSAPPPRL